MMATDPNNVELFEEWQNAASEQLEPTKAIQPPELDDFLAEDFPDSKRLLGPIHNESVIIGAGPPGSGKTNVAIGIAHAVCAGRNFLGWHAPDKHSVFYVDGEMSGRQLQDRLNLYDFPDDHEPLHIVNAISWVARQGLEHPNLAHPDWQERICEWANGRRLVILDNVVSLVNAPGLSFSSDEFWRTVIPLNLRLRAMGCTVIWLDHTNAEGRPFGTRTKEWGADLVFTLKENDRTSYYDDCPGVAFTVSFRKVRGIKGKEHQNIDCEMCPDENGKAVWTWKTTKATEMHEAAALQASGMTQRQISRQTGMALGKVNKLLKAANKAHEYAGSRG